MIWLRALTFSRTSSASAGAIAEQVADADAAAADLVLVGRADAARGRADLALAAPRFRQHVELAVIRQDDVRLLADAAGGRRRRCPCAASSSTSLNSACGSMTTPLPMTQATPGCRMPDGIRCSTNLRAARRRPCGRRCGRPDSARRRQKCGVSMSTILPLPSSPHCAPSTAMFVFDIGLYSITKPHARTTIALRHSPSRTRSPRRDECQSKLFLRKPLTRRARSITSDLPRQRVPCSVPSVS